MRTVRTAACTIALAFALLRPCPALAADGIRLTWNDCPNDPSADNNFQFTCGTNELEERLFCSFQLDTPLDQVIGLIAVVDAISSDAVLPNWWHLAAIGDCRSGNLFASADFSAYSSCADPWRGLKSAEVQGFAITEPRGASNTFRIKVAAGVLPDSAATIAANQLYYGAVIIVLNDLTTGPLTCSGCTVPACLVLNSIELVRLNGAPGGNRVLTMPSGAGTNWARWNGGSGADCALVPVRRSTWGAIKGMYR